MDNKTNEPAKIKVIVHIEDGMVNDVYSDNPNIDLEIIDMDTQDWDVKGSNKQQLAEIKGKVYRQELFKF
jgi:hypothetical protein